MATTTLKVDGMTCGACTSAVESGFKGIEGAGAVSVSLMMGRAVVHHDPVKLPPEKLAEIIEDCGFDAEVLTTDIPQPTTPASQQDGPDGSDETASKITTTTISVKGMTCGACTSSVEAGFKDVPGVKSMSVSLLAERAVVQHDADIISAEALAEIIEDRGFDATVLECKTQETIKPATGDALGTNVGSTTWTTTVAIEGMTCGACTSSVEGAFKNVPGLVRFNISLLAERAVVSHDPAVLPAEKIVELIEDAGFDAKIVSSQAETTLHGAPRVSQQLKIYGLPDGKAATDLENELRAKPGIKNAVISLSTSRATVTYDPAMIGLRMIVGVIEAAGFNALVADSEDNNAQLESLAKTKEIQEWRRAFLTSLAFAIPVFLISMVIPMLFPSSDFGAIQIIPGLFLGDIICCALTIPVQFGIGKRFYRSAYKSLKHRSPTMDVLVVLGTSAAFFFSCFSVVVAVIIPPHNKPGTVFDTSTMLITFITLGRWLENRAKGQTSKALSNLMSLAPSMATIYEDPVYAEKLADAWAVPESPTLEKTPSISSRHNSVSAPSGPSAVEKVIPTELLEVGDVVILRPGDKVPADGIVTRGESYVDESMVTGEPMPILKKKGSALIAGTVNGAGKVDFKVTRAGKDTQLSQIVNLVQEAQTSRAPIQRMADLVAGYFVPIIILLGLTTFIGWMVLSHTMRNPPEIFVDNQSGGKFMVCLKLCISVIVFACPCALGLATPTAVMVGTGTASQQGILVKGGAALEAATRITHIVLDKTGTLTFGKLQVADTHIDSAWTSNPWRVKVWWTLMGLAEAGSEHPIARSVVAAAKDKLDLEDEEPFSGQVINFAVIVGEGVSALIELESSTRKSDQDPANPEQTRYKVYVGNAKFLRNKKIPIPSEFEDEGNSASPLATAASQKSKTGITTVYVAINGQYAGMLELSDTLKPTAPAAIAALHKMGISTSLVTGDTYNTALSIAQLVGIPRESIRASVSPGDKQAIVAELQSQGEVVAMVGDGINDSPALATANIGIGLVSGSDIAVEAADIVIMRSDDLLNIPAALHLCRVIFRRIKMNLVWACAYNVLGLPFAMGIFLPLGYHMPPLMSATAMMFSSISVTLSSLALRWARRPKWLTVEAMELESAKIAVPVVGQKRKLGYVATVRDFVSGLFDGALVKRRAEERDRGNYVPLRTVEPV
ncbi:Cu2+-exporting ATPase [Capronia coronata CBS 617.96]|uniref:Cu2+-exporting ATPase n=1 Tax=Capronia coronata CBS 617.96 TaxID=1182541 RepID=W9Y1Q3_9EURO|nr:Cu2+-exporting ATPase [Capronia coronata CBS 617.96]EXJ83565.1 Cu2+-exporting ATPase [Capronia coronata CBS 617.96]